MKDFLKFTLATVTGIILSTVILFFLSILMMFSMMASSGSETQVQDNSIMTLDLNRAIEERSNAEDPMTILLGDNDNSTMGLDDILSAIKKAEENEDIKGIYLQSGTLAASAGTLEEIRRALLDFKKSGKFVVAYGDYYSQGAYYLCSVADKVMLNPQGSLDWHGMASQPMFYKDLLEKIGVEMQIFKVGTYKSAVEPYINTEMSLANREQVTAFMGSMWNTFLTDVSASRNISKDSLNALADRMMALEEAKEAVKAGLADTLIYKNDVKDYIKSLMALDEDDDLHQLKLKEMVNIKNSEPKDKSGNIIAVYYAFGGIDDGTSPDEGIVSKKVIKDLKKLEKDDDVKAVVLRVNSPGGSAYGSEQIWYAVSQLKKEKPVIVSMGDYAASGGYYISCNADTIVADATTLTGSIGIFGMFPNAEKLTQKVGLDFDVVKTNKFSDFGDIARPMNEAEKALMQNMIERGYDLFLTRCSEGRGIDKASLDSIAQGHVWTGEKALELGLVDVLGGLDTALEIAISKAGVEKYSVRSYPEKESIFDALLNEGVGNLLKSYVLDNYLLKGHMGELYRQANLLERIDEMDRIQARMPFEPNIH